MLLSFDHVSITYPTGRGEEVRAYYGGVLGMKEVQPPETMQGRGLVWFAMPDGRVLHLVPDDEYLAPKLSHPAFVADLDALAASVENPTWDELFAPRRRFYLRDPFGNLLEFLEPRQSDSS
jgi:catechol 2,3-dioxygenase-like lactoylglutathione lyase family enzyme